MVQLSPVRPDHLPYLNIPLIALPRPRRSANLVSGRRFPKTGIFRHAAGTSGNFAPPLAKSGGSHPSSRKFPVRNEYNSAGLEDGHRHMKTGWLRRPSAGQSRRTSPPRSDKASVQQPVRIVIFGFHRTVRTSSDRVFGTHTPRVSRRVMQSNGFQVAQPIIRPDNQAASRRPHRIMSGAGIRQNGRY
jgi:hypothetical protein